jgi:hypothetical protein
VGVAWQREKDTKMEEEIHIKSIFHCIQVRVIGDLKYSKMLRVLIPMDKISRFCVQWPCK